MVCGTVLASRAAWCVSVVGAALSALSSVSSFSGVKWSVLLLGRLNCSNPVSVLVHGLHEEVTASMTAVAALYGYLMILLAVTRGKKK